MLRRVGIQFNSNYLGELINTLDDLAEMPPQFNELFAHRGWIAYGWIDSTAAREAIAKARAGDIPAAEEILVAAHDADAVAVHLRTLRALRCFKRRGRLASLALEDYKAGRYHACVPVVLALLDGMGQELTGAGFLRQGARFVDDDSFLETGPGTSALIRTLTQTRPRTTEEEIDIPYRHGVLHGVDLGYDTLEVAAKAWAALLALGYYAKQVEDAQASTPDQKGLLESFHDTVRTIANTQRVQTLSEAWAPRPASELAAAIAAPQPGTPEYAARAILEYWHRGNFGRLAQTASDPRKTDWKALAGKVRKQLGEGPRNYRVIGAEDMAPATAVITVALAWPDYSETTQLRLTYHDEHGVVPFNAGGGEWRLVSLWPLEAARHSRAAAAAGRTR